MKRRERIIKYLLYKENFLAYHRRKLEMGKVVFEIQAFYLDKKVINFFFKPIFIAQPQSRFQEKKFNEKLNEPYFKTKWVPSLLRTIFFILLFWLIAGRTRNLIVYGSLLYTPDSMLVEQTILSIFKISNPDTSFNFFYVPSVNYAITKGCIYFDLFDLSLL